MITEKKIIEILNSYSDYVDRSRTEQAVSEINFELVAKDIFERVEKGGEFQGNQCDNSSSLTEILKSDSVYTLLRFGFKSPSNSGMDDCDDNYYYDLYKLVCELRKH